MSQMSMEKSAEVRFLHVVLAGGCADVAGACC